MGTGISGLSISLNEGTTGLKATWSKANKKYKKTTTGKGNKKKTVYEFKEYKVVWYYLMPNNQVWYHAAPEYITSWDTTRSTYSYPETATRVKVSVQLILKKGTKTPPPFKTLTSKPYYIRKIVIPNTPTVNAPIVDLNNKATLSVNISQQQVNVGVDRVYFTVRKGHKNKNGQDSYEEWKKNVAAKVRDGKAQYHITLDPGYFYHYRAYTYSSESDQKSELSEWSDVFYTASSAPTGLTVSLVNSSEIKVEFSVKGYVEGYELQYATEERYLGTNSEFAESKTWNEEDRQIKTHKVSHSITGFNTGQKYYFKVRATCGNYGNSPWSKSTSISVGREPGPPSTYSSKTAAQIGETVYLYWVHNSQDGSSQTQAEIALYVNNQSLLNNKVVVIDNPYINDEYQKDKTLSLPITLINNSRYDPNDSSLYYNFKDGDILYWMVRTKGVYAPPAKTEKHTDSFRVLYTPGEPIVVVANDDIDTFYRVNYSEDPDDPYKYGQYSDSMGFIGIQGRVVTFDPNGGTVIHYEETTYLDVLLVYDTIKRGFSDWSALKQISMFQQPEASVVVKTGWEMNNSSTIEEIADALDDIDPVDFIDSYPIAVIMSASPESQKAISFNLIISNAGSEYESKNAYGEDITIAPNEVLYQRYFDVGDFDKWAVNQKTLILYPSDVILDNGQTYKFKLEAYMSSGLSATDETSNLTALFEEYDFEIETTILPNFENYSVSIMPICFDRDESGDDSEDSYDIDDVNMELLSENVLLDVYRIETDGSVTLIESGLENTGDVVTSDDHPSLDYARYRIVARKTTSAYADYDDFYEEMGVSSLVIQWDESSINAFEYGEAMDTVDDIDDVTMAPVYQRGMLVLPYNIDTTEDYKPDVSFVSYIGREHPVSYYGTQKGHTASWSTTIDKKDDETLFRLRKLANYMGDCYVREPSGTGYWANVQVNWTQTHNDPALPISLNITRVDAHPITREEIQDNEGGDESA